MLWPKSLNLFTRKRTQPEVCEEEVQDDTGDLHPCPSSPDQSCSNKPKRRSLSTELSCGRRGSGERRTSLDLWHEARRARNSIEGQNPATMTDKLSICKAGQTTIVNKKYLTIKHLGSGTFGRVMLCLNIEDQKLYAVKICRKSQFIAHRGSAQGRFRRPSGYGGGCYGAAFSRAFSVTADSTAASGFAVRPVPGRPAVPLPGQNGSPAGLDCRGEELVKEIAILKKLRHPNIVQLVEVIDDPRADNLLLVMEYVEGKTLEPRKVDAIRWERTPENDVWHFAREVLLGLDYLHFHRTVHGDLKPANLLLDSNTRKVKIVDFGSSRMYSDKAGSRGSPAFSTPAFRSPESLQSGYQLSFEMDMWALGVCMFLWLFGELPFNAAGPFAVYEKIRNTEFRFPEGVEVSLELRNLLEGLLNKDVCNRFDVASALQHPWITANGTAPLQSFHVSGGQAGFALGMQVTQQDIEDAIVQTDGGIHDLMAVVFEEENFVDGEALVVRGSRADKIFLVASGRVEIVDDGIDADESQCQPFISGVEIDMSDAQDPGLVDAGTESFSGGLLSGKDASSRLCDAPDGVRAMVVKGSGEAFGFPCLQKGCLHMHFWKATIRARGPVKAFVASVDSLQKLVEQHPELRASVELIVSQQKTDMMVTQAMRQLTLCHYPFCVSPDEVRVEVVCSSSAGI